MSLCKEEVECPTCTQRAIIPPGGLNAFPTSDRFSRVAFKTLCDPEFTYLPGGPNPRCGLHPTEEVSHYCHECQVQICGKCVTSYHKEHEAEMEDIGAVANEMDQELASVLDSSIQEVGFRLVMKCIYCKIILYSSSCNYINNKNKNNDNNNKIFIYGG